jgi:hypothetical protein
MHALNVYVCICMYMNEYCWYLLSKCIYFWEVYKDPMHAYDHGVAMHIINAVVRTLHKLEVHWVAQKYTGNETDRTLADTRTSFIE